MALSKEEFAKLRKQGLSVEQIVSFESGQKPTLQTPQETKNPVKPWDTSGFTSGIKGVGKGLGKLALGVGTIGRTIQEGAARLVGQDLKETSIFDIGSEQRVKAEEVLRPKNTGEKISSFITEVGATALPSGAAIKATSGLSFARAMLGRGAIGAVTGTVQGGGDVDKDTLIGAGTEIMFPLAGKAIGYGGKVLKSLAGLSTGVGSDVIEQVVKSPKAALVGGADDSVSALKQTATAIREGSKQIRTKAGDEFANLTKNHTEQLSKPEFNKLVADYLDEFDSSTFIETKNIDKVRGVIQSWDDYSAQGLNKLASKVSKFYTGSAASTDTDRLVSGLNRTIRNWIGDQIPDIAEANAKYADKMDLIEQMDALFKLRGSVDDRLGMQKTAEAVSRLFNANKDIAREGVEELQKELGVDVLGREAGRQLVSGVTTKFQAGASDGVVGVTRAFIPPKLVLRLAATTGMAKNAIEQRINTLEPVTRAAVLEVLTDLLGEGEGQDQQKIQ